MKRVALFFSLLAALQAPAAHSRAADPETKPSTTLLEEAETLSQIYLKLRLLGASLEGPELQESLNAMNRALDKVLAFRESFTPEKKRKIEARLKNLQKDSKKIIDGKGQNFEKDLSILVDRLLDLLKALKE